MKLQEGEPAFIFYGGFLLLVIAAVAVAALNAERAAPSNIDKSPATQQ